MIKKAYSISLVSANALLTFEGQNIVAEKDNANTRNIAKIKIVSGFLYPIFKKNLRKIGICTKNEITKK